MNRTNSLIVMAALSLIMSATSLQAASPPTRIMAAQSITAPGSYVLANDITGTSGGGAIEIQASDVTLNLNGHTITSARGSGIIIDGSDTNNVPLVNAHVSNGKIVAANQGVAILGSSCLVNGLNITVSSSGTPISIKNGNFNRVNSCVLSAATGQTGSAAFSLFLTSHNVIQNNTLAGIYSDTIQEDDQAGAFGTVVGDNTFSGNQFASPTP
jgi:hypothetical protein